MDPQALNSFGVPIFHATPEYRVIYGSPHTESQLPVCTLNLAELQPLECVPPEFSAIDSNLQRVELVNPQSCDEANSRGPVQSASSLEYISVPITNLTVERNLDSTEIGYKNMTPPSAPIVNETPVPPPKKITPRHNPPLHTKDPTDPSLSKIERKSIHKACYSKHYREKKKSDYASLKEEFQEYQERAKEEALERDLAFDKLRRDYDLLQREYYGSLKKNRELEKKVVEEQRKTAMWELFSNSSLLPQ